MKNLRDIRNNKHDSSAHHHHCGMAMKEHGLGYTDLDKLLNKPEKMEFIFGKSWIDRKMESCS